MARIGYAVASTLEQYLDGQLDRLKSDGCSLIRSAKVSCAGRDGSPELATIVELLRTGDELVLTRLDRLGRYTSKALNLIQKCEHRGAFVSFPGPHFPTCGEVGHVVPKVLGMVANMGRFSKERQREGIERAKAESIADEIVASGTLEPRPLPKSA